jgi:hypothetical protein
MMRLNHSSLGISRLFKRIYSTQSTSNAIFSPLFLTSHAFSFAPSPSSSSLSFHSLLRTKTKNRNEKEFLIASPQRRSLSTVASPIGGVSRTGAGEEGGIIPPLENDFNSKMSRLWVKVKEELTHMKKGSIALGRNIVAVVRIGLAKIKDGTPVTRRERQLLVQVSDLPLPLSASQALPLLLFILLFSFFFPSFLDFRRCPAFDSLRSDCHRSLHGIQSPLPFETVSRPSSQYFHFTSLKVRSTTTSSSSQDRSREVLDRSI